MELFKNLNNKKIVIGLVHLLPLPGSPDNHDGAFNDSLEKAIQDSLALQRGGADGCLIQTSERVYPASDHTDYARVSSLSIITHEVKKVVNPDFHVGVQMMWNCITPSLAVAKTSKASFIRTTAFIGTTSSPYGIIEANPLKIQNYRRYINAFDVAIISEIKGYHFNWLGSEMPITKLATLSMKSGANCVEVMDDDEDINNKMVTDIKIHSPEIPVILGGKTNLENVKRRLSLADGALVGTCFQSGNWGTNIDEAIVKEYVNIVRSLE